MLTQLPPKRRQIVTILLKKSDIALATAIVSEANQKANKQNDGTIAEVTENSHEPKGMWHVLYQSSNDVELFLSSVFKAFYFYQ